MPRTYGNVMVAVDNSECSGYAEDLAVELCRATGARLTAAHVYAARLHDIRFRQLEPGLPERYQREGELLRQRRIHEDLIGRGLGIISDSYLRVLEQKCLAAGVPVEGKALEGRNYAELVKDARGNGYDLVILGAHGLGRVDRSVLGSVCERVTRLVDGDVLVARDGRPLDSGRLMVAIDGSAHSSAALKVAFGLSRLFGNPVAAVAAYDPHFHGVAFKSLAGVLSEEASRLFRFREQEILHDEIIDKGLAQVYRSYLSRAQELAAQEGLSLETQVLEGKPFDVVASLAGRMQPALLLVGRVGIHHEEGVTLGSTAENLLRFAPCNVLVAKVQADNLEAGGRSMDSAHERPEMVWKEEAETRLGRIPPFVRNMARKRIERFAREEGYGEISLEVYEKARQRFGM